MVNGVFAVLIGHLYVRCIMIDDVLTGEAEGSLSQAASEIISANDIAVVALRLRCLIIG